MTYSLENRSLFTSGRIKTVSHLVFFALCIAGFAINEIYFDYAAYVIALGVGFWCLIKNYETQGSDLLGIFAAGLAVACVYNMAASSEYAARLEAAEIESYELQETLYALEQ